VTLFELIGLGILFMMIWCSSLFYKRKKAF
jgi:hypothetical protein